jgi:hypothetical protein
MKFNLFHHGGGNAPTQKEVPTSPSQDEESKLAPGATTVVNKKNKTADSDEIIAKVDAAYKEFTAFQTNLKTLLRLYKDEHHAMITIHEKRFEVSVYCDGLWMRSRLTQFAACIYNNTDCQNIGFDVCILTSLKRSCAGQPICSCTS